MLGCIIDCQFLRFVIVGLVSNSILFIAYLFLTKCGVDSKIAMTALYVIGVFQSFILNKKWTFSHGGKNMSGFVAYICLYAIGYLLNLWALFLLVDKLNFQHQWVQGLITVLLAGFFFLAQKFIVFKSDNQ
ncbi:GtrA family protein [Plesiomonas sp. ZOR0011]|uniref:GtrA family protein n=1 Tax=Plesiomonas sp. ZOR0011 TaxID=1339230 RepID=UPI000646EBDE|nr:GtrA family protein [Plesiomonas sp. ZOR0011]